MNKNIFFQSLNLKKITCYSGVLYLFVLLNSSCSEIGPNIDLAGNTLTDTTYIATEIEAPQTKNILLEEFTGVRCVNCPQGHEVLDNLENQHGERFIAVSGHSRFLADPYPGDQDLRVEDAQALEDLLGPAIAKPSASVDRVLFPGETSLLYFTQKWAGYVNQRMSASTPVNLYVETIFNENNRQLNVTVTLHYTTNEPQDNKLTIILMEDGIITSQLGNSGIEPHYVQNRVLRKVLTSTNGLTITESKTPGRVVVKSFIAENLPEIWDVSEMKLIALVHRSTGTTEVLQAVEKKID